MLIIIRSDWSFSPFHFGYFYVKGAFRYGAWDVYYGKKQNGLVSYKCYFNKKRYENAVAFSTVPAVSIITISCIATGGATSPGYAVLAL